VCSPSTPHATEEEEEEGMGSGGGEGCGEDEVEESFLIKDPKGDPAALNHEPRDTVTGILQTWARVSTRTDGTRKHSVS